MLHESLSPPQEPLVLPISLMVDFVKQRVSLIKRSDRPIFVHIAGPSGSGKSECARMLTLAMQQCSVFSMDSYLKGGQYVAKLEKNSTRSTESFFGEDDIRVFDIDTIARDIGQVSKGITIAQPEFDMRRGERKGYKLFTPKRVIIVEGIHALHPNLIPFADLSLFVETPLHDRLLRRVVRDCRQYESAPLSQIIFSYLTQVEPSFQQYAAPFRNSADAVINNLYRLIDYEGIESIEDQGSDTQESTIAVYRATPKVNYGTKHPDEKLIIIELEDGRRIFRYYVDEKMLLNNELSDKAFSVLGQFYDFELVLT